MGVFFFIMLNLFAASFVFADENEVLRINPKDSINQLPLPPDTESLLNPTKALPPTQQQSTKEALDIKDAFGNKQNSCSLIHLLFLGRVGKKDSIQQLPLPPNAESLLNRTQPLPPTQHQSIKEALGKKLNKCSIMHLIFLGRVGKKYEPLPTPQA